MKPAGHARKPTAASSFPPQRPGDGARRNIRRQMAAAPAETPGEHVPPDRVEIASMDSFPCSDPPAYNTSRV